MITFNEFLKLKEAILPKPKMDEIKTFMELHFNPEEIEIFDDALSNDETDSIYTTLVDTYENYKLTPFTYQEQMLINFIKNTISSVRQRTKEQEEKRQMLEKPGSGPLPYGV